MNDPRVPIGFYLRFMGFGVLMAVVNVVPYLLTQGGADAMEKAGWPLCVYRSGGVSGVWDFNAWAMMANMGFAFLVAAFATWLFHDGVLITLNRWRLWGTPWAIERRCAATDETGPQKI